MKRKIDFWFRTIHQSLFDEWAFGLWKIMPSPEIPNVWKNGQISVEERWSIQKWSRTEKQAWQCPFCKPACSPRFDTLVVESVTSWIPIIFPSTYGVVVLWLFLRFSQPCLCLPHQFSISESSASSFTPCFPSASSSSASSFIIFFVRLGLRRSWSDFWGGGQPNTRHLLYLDKSRYLRLNSLDRVACMYMNAPMVSVLRPDRR